MPELLYVGIDVGTSGVRAVAVDGNANLVGETAVALPPPVRQGAAVEQEPTLWRAALAEVIGRLGDADPLAAIDRMAIDGTSATLLVTDAAGTPLGPALMYNDARSTEAATRVAEVAPADAACHGPSAALAKLLWLSARHPAARYALHQADWLASLLTGRLGLSDENNALKLGYDAVTRTWPAWFAELPIPADLLPAVLPPGSPLAPAATAFAESLGLPPTAMVVAGTTDGVAAFLATGAGELGDAVTSLGSTLVVKVLSDKPVTAAAAGVYSHRLGDHWLPGGASNSGGAALQCYFDQATMARLTPLLQPDQPTGLDYYPLPGVGERFPVGDPALTARVTPRPADEARFFQGLLEGIAAIEKAGYEALQALGAPYPRRLFTVGGGASNPAWTTIRHRLLGIPFHPPASTQAAFGTALLARRSVSHSASSNPSHMLPSSSAAK